MTRRWPAKPLKKASRSPAPPESPPRWRARSPSLPRSLLGEEPERALAPPRRSHRGRHPDRRLPQRRHRRPGKGRVPRLPRRLGPRPQPSARARSNASLAAVPSQASIGHHRRRRGRGTHRSSVTSSPAAIILGASRHLCARTLIRTGPNNASRDAEPSSSTNSDESRYDACSRLREPSSAPTTRLRRSPRHSQTSRRPPGKTATCPRGDDN